MGAEILTSKGDETICSKVVGHKHDYDRNPVDLSNDEPLYIIEYLDGSLSMDGYNARLSALNLQLDQFSDEYIPSQKYLCTSSSPRVARATRKAGFSRFYRNLGDHLGAFTFCQGGPAI